VGRRLRDPGPGIPATLNLVVQLDTIKVVEYDRSETRVQQTSELRANVEALLVKLGVPPPPRLHTIGPIPSDPAGTAA
jgi:hypothetical protein